MATVFIQKKKRKNRNSYVIMYKNPLTGKNKYYKTLQKQKDAQKAANDLSTLLDTGKLPVSNKEKRKVMAITFREIGALLDNVWKQKVTSSELSPKTYEDYSLRLNQLNDIFGKGCFAKSAKDRCSITEMSLQKRSPTRPQIVICSLSSRCSNRVVEEGAILENLVEPIGYLSEKDHERKRQ